MMRDAIAGTTMLAVMFLCPWRVAAQTVTDVQPPAAIQISPVHVDWHITSGETRRETVNIKNYDRFPRTVTVQVEDFYVSDDSSRAEFFVPADSHPLKAYDMINWVSVSETEFVLAPNESRNIECTIAVPNDTPSGGYYGAIFFQSASDAASDDDAAHIRVNTRVGMLVTLAVAGDAPLYTGATLASFTPSPRLSWGAPMTLITRVGNTGNVHFAMNGTIDIFRGTKRHAQIALPTQLYYPRRDRVIQTSWNPGPWTVGRFTARVHLTSEDGSVVTDGETSFVVVSWRVVASVAGALSAAGIMYMLGVAAAKRHLRRDEQ